MNTPTPKTDEWETYCDEWYYHMWRVRRKNERGFNDGFHVQNGQEAKQLVELLNMQDEELTAARKEIERLKDHCRIKVKALINQTSERMKAEQQRDVMEKKLRIELRGHPDSELWGDAGLIAATMRCVDALDEVTEQRDRLAEALANLVNANETWNQGMMDVIGRPPNWNDSYLNEAKEALQSLNPNEP